jgi:outer membrane protein OmpA-like peptidoglycan-associated protein
VTTTQGGRAMRWALSWLSAGALACGSPARPPVMARMAEVHGAPATIEAETWAPQAHAHALELEARAEGALRGGDAEAAASLAEHAIAAHEHAWVLTRFARAERRRLEAEKELDQQRRILSELRAQHQQLSAEAAALELRAQVARGGLPVPPHEASPAERREARRAAAAALSAQARLLCVGARLLGEERRVTPVIEQLDELDRQLASGAESKSIEAASLLRSRCLDAISEIRRQNSAPSARPSGPAPATPDTPTSTRTVPVANETRAIAPRPADVLLDELSAAGAAPSRDDRGVAVSLRGLFGADGKLTERARSELARLVRVSEAHPDFPVLLVGHSGSDRSATELGRQLQLVRTALADSGVSKLAVESVGDRQPLLPARSPLSSARNQRIELIFVAPGF